jgi:hypothetical protein
MISNERPSPYGCRPPQPRPPVQEDTIKYGELAIEGTSFRFVLKENPRGRFLRITGKRDEVLSGLIIPYAGLEAFNDLLGKVAKAAKKSVGNLKAEPLQIGRKRFDLELDEDLRGRFLRISEKVGVYSNELIVIVSGLEGFRNWVDEMAKVAKERALIAPAWSEAPPNEETLKTGEMQLERKAFTFALKKNSRGRFLRITEEKDGRFNNIIIPSEGLEDFKKLVVEMAKASKKLVEQTPGEDRSPGEMKPNNPFP